MACRAFDRRWCRGDLTFDKSPSFTNSWIPVAGHRGSHSRLEAVLCCWPVSPLDGNVEAVATAPQVSVINQPKANALAIIPRLSVSPLHFMLLQTFPVVGVTDFPNNSPTTFMYINVSYDDLPESEIYFRTRDIPGPRATQP